MRSTWFVSPIFRQSLSEIHSVKLHLSIDRRELKSPFTYQRFSRCERVFLWIEEMLSFCMGFVTVYQRTDDICALHDVPIVLRHVISITRQPVPRHNYDNEVSVTRTEGTRAASS